MNPEERTLLERSLKLSEENNKMLRSMHSKMRWAVLWGIIKMAVIIVPLVIGYLYLEPYLGSVSETFKNAQEVLNTIR